MFINLIQDIIKFLPKEANISYVCRREDNFNINIIFNDAVEVNYECTNKKCFIRKVYTLEKSITFKTLSDAVESIKQITDLIEEYMSFISDYEMETYRATTLADLEDFESYFSNPLPHLCDDWTSPFEPHD